MKTAYYMKIYYNTLKFSGIESTDRCLAHPEVPSTTTDHQGNSINDYSGSLLI